MIILAVMVLPFLASTSAEAFRVALTRVREAVLSLGVTQVISVLQSDLDKSLAGVIGSRGFRAGARGLGETLAVLMLCGNSAALPTSLMDRGQPITALLATELPGETVVHSHKYPVLLTGGSFSSSWL